MIKFLYLPVALVLLCAAGAVPQDKTPDLSGVWRWNAPKSTLSSPAKDLRVKIEQNGPDLLVTWRVLTEMNEVMQASYYHIGSDDNRNLGNQGVPLKSSTRWQGSSLAIDSVSVGSKDESPKHELWTLSKDGSTLIFKGYRRVANEQGGEDTIVFGRQSDDTWEPPQKILASSQVYQNIQVIREPAWHLPSGMMSLTKWLGVECSYCHTLNEFEKDDKAPKKTARMMFKMVHDINENFPGTEPGNFKVTCWTCHRGSIKPETAMPVPGLKPSGR